MRQGPSFTQIVKDDIVRFKEKEEVDFSYARKRAILSAFARLNGHLTIKDHRSSLVLSTESAKIAKFIYSLFREFYDVNPSLGYLRSMRFARRTRFEISINDQVDDILDHLGISFLDGKISKEIVNSDDTAAGYATGAFLASGSVNSPISSNYHLEISTTDAELAKKILRLIERFKRANFTPKIIERKNHFVVYFKKSDQIGEFLIFIGATAASLEFEATRIHRDMQNATNRMQICDSANYQKTLASSQKQLEDIRAIDRLVGIKRIENEKIRILCELRLENEDMNMQELATALSEALNLDVPVSKSNIAHLFRAISKLASNFKGKSS